jgi:hypothetical protein
MLAQRRFLVALLALAILLAITGAWWWVIRATPEIQGRVLDIGGAPISGARVVFSGGGSTTSDADGHFVIASLARGGWVTASHDGFLQRTRAAQSDHETLVRLFADGDDTIRLLFGGDVMFGRRFYDQNDDGDRSDGLLRLGATSQEHLRLLSGVAPLLADADLTIVNLETPLIRDPWVNPHEPRPSRFHSTKEFVFGSAPEAAQALHQAGVDILGLGNNHLYDALDAGIVSTQRALLDAGYAKTDFVGAGRNLDEAWRPATREVRGQRVAVVACTTITGVEQPVTYVAGPEKGGAAACEDVALTDAIRAAAANADLVIAMIHGGFEYVRDPSGKVMHFSRVANDAGADLVIDHHPHVVGGLAAADERITAWTMGNLLFDQTVWPTFGSYVLRVDARNGAVMRAYLEPIMLRGFRPVGVVGQEAAWIAREAQSLSDGPWVVDDGSLTLDATAMAQSKALVLPPVDRAISAPVLDLDGGCLARVPAGAMVGRDETWTGDFEDGTADDMTAGGELWNLFDANPDRQLLRSVAEHGDYGVRLVRTGGDSQDILLAPLHRLLVREGEQMSLFVAARGSSEAAGSAQLSWYNDTVGPSEEQSVVALALTGEWQTFRIDFTVPENGVAAGLYIRLAPPPANESSMDIDNVRTVVWREASRRPACEYLRLKDAAQADKLRATATRFLGDDAAPHPDWAGGIPLTVDPVVPLPPGPADGGWGDTE